MRNDLSSIGGQASQDEPLFVLIGKAHNLRWRLMSLLIDHVCRMAFIVIYVLVIAVTAAVKMNYSS